MDRHADASRGTTHGITDARNSGRPGDTLTRLDRVGLGEAGRSGHAPYQPTAAAVRIIFRCLISIGKACLASPTTWGEEPCAISHRVAAIMMSWPVIMLAAKVWSNAGPAHVRLTGRHNAVTCRNIQDHTLKRNSTTSPSCMT